MTGFSLLGDPRVLRDEVWRRSRRAALIGLGVAAAVGLLAGVALFALQLLVPGGSGEGFTVEDSAPVAGYVLVLLAIGAAAGLQVVNLGLAQQMLQAFGGGQAGRRVRRIVLRGDQPVNEEEAVRAAAYARAAAVVIPLQVIAGTLLLAAVGLNLFVQLFTLDVGPVLHALDLVVLLALVGTGIVLVPVQVRSARRAQHYRSAAGPGDGGPRG